jgi:hypothetical protein
MSRDPPSRSVLHPRAWATTTSADFSLRAQVPSPFQAQGEISPGKNAILPRTLRRIYTMPALTTRASRFLARSPCCTAPHMRFLSIGSRVTFHASFPRSVALTQLHFASLAVVGSREDLHLQDRAHAGRTRGPAPCAAQSRASEPQPLPSPALVLAARSRQTTTPRMTAMRRKPPPPNSERFDRELANAFKLTRYR